MIRDNPSFRPHRYTEPPEDWLSGLSTPAANASWPRSVNSVVGPALIAMPEPPFQTSTSTSGFRDDLALSLSRRCLSRRRNSAPKIMTRIPAATDPIVMPVVCPEYSRFASVCSTLLARAGPASRAPANGTDWCMSCRASLASSGTIIAVESFSTGGCRSEVQSNTLTVV